MDLVLAKANQIGVRLIIPFVDNWRWMGGIGEYAAFRGEEPGAFWTDPQIRADFKATIEYVLNRRNTQTGVIYKNDKAILAWELGNELRDAPPEWIAEMAAFVKTIDNRHLLSDGLQCSYLREDVIADSNIDILATHHYEFNAEQTIRNIETSVLKIGNKKPYYIGEFGFFDLPGTEKIIDAVIAEKKVAGALLWSLRFHNRDGGFYWHSERVKKSFQGLSLSRISRPPVTLKSN
jgi:endo-1,4-beta-mannosidase